VYLRVFTIYVAAPVDKMAEVLRKTTKEAKDMISKVNNAVN